MARKKKKQSQGVYYLILFICAVCLAYEPVAKILSDARQKNSTPAKIELTAGTRLEIPAKLKNVSEQILQRKGYTVSYNKDLKIPNWVAWELIPEKLVERESRTDKFLPDPDLPEHEAVTTDDYKGAGMDRGHMCSAGDNRWHWKAMQESFYMTNICPQNHNLNRGDWKSRGWEIPATVGHKKKARYTLYAVLFSMTNVTAPLVRSTKLQCPKHSSRSFCVQTAIPPKPSASFIRMHRAIIRWTATSIQWTKWNELQV